MNEHRVWVPLQVSYTDNRITEFDLRIIFPFPGISFYLIYWGQGHHHTCGTSSCVWISSCMWTPSCVWDTIMCVEPSCMWTDTVIHVDTIRRQPLGISVSLHHGSQIVKPGLQSWCQVPLPAQPSPLSSRVCIFKKKKKKDKTEICHGLANNLLLLPCKENGKCPCIPCFHE